MQKNFTFWINVTRAYSIPMSIMSFMVPFVFGLSDGGNLLYGLIALLGIILAHAGINMFDDFSDYLMAQRAVAKGQKIEDIFQKGKCKHLLNNNLSMFHLFIIISVFLTFATILGIYLGLKTGFFVFYIMIIAGLLGIAYPFLTFIALGEVTVGIMFAPLLYFGVYYVMTKSFSAELTPLAISTGLLTIGLLHAHMFMDFDFDKKNKKITLCSLAGSKKNAVKTQLIIMGLAYLNIIYQCFNGLEKTYLIVFFSLPTAIVLYKLMKNDAELKNETIKPNLFFGILENLKQYKQNGNLDFMIKFMVARNVMVEFTFLICIAKIISEII